MSVIKIKDIAYVSLSAPDIARMQAFMEDFGLVRAEDVGDEVLRMRGAGPAPFLHQTREGDASFVGVGLRATSAEDVERLASAEGLPTHPLTSPGGGLGVTLHDPDNIRIDVIGGDRPALPLPLGERLPWNDSTVRPRSGATRGYSRGRALVTRLGHCVFRSSDLRRSEAWWKERFGLLTSDEVVDAEGSPKAIFMRCDCGTEPTDHHTLLLSQAAPGEPLGLHHTAFEVRDFDDLMAGHEHLAAKGYEAVWGIGRHVLGGQVFDYWLDPFGNRVEHWTDGDLFTAADGSNVVGQDVMFSNHWGPPPSPRFIDPSTPAH